MMLISMNPAIVFAEDIAQGSDPAPVSDESAVTPEDVYESLADATTSELNAAKEFFPSEETWDEVGAAANEVAAAKALSDAEEIVEAAEEQTDKAADDAYKSMEDAGKAADNAETFNGYAGTAQGYAEEQQVIAEGQGTSKEDAEKAAVLAGGYAAIADFSAAFAAEQAKKAADAADAAKASYEEAQAAYDAAVAEVNKKLAAGLINAQEAADLTKAAAEKADLAHKEWDTKKAEADEAAREAQEKAEAANKKIEEQIKVLDEVIDSTAKDVADKTGTAVVTGSALAAAKAALGASKLEITYYEGRINIEEAKIDVLNEKIADAEAKIEAADAVLLVKEAALVKASDDYKTKKKELDEAEEQLELARDAVERVKDIIEKRDESGIKAQLSAVRSGDFYSTDVHDVAEYLMKDDPNFDKLEWDSMDSDLFVIEGKWYKVSVQELTDPESGEVLDRILAINEYFPDVYEEVTDLPDAAKTWKNGDEPGYQPTDMIATNSIGTGSVYLRKVQEGELIFFRYEVIYNGKAYELLKDGTGFYIENSKGTRRDVTVKAPKTGDVVGDTTKIAADWDYATAKENDYAASQAAVKGAVSAKNLAELVLEKAQNEYDAVDKYQKKQIAKRDAYNGRKTKHVEHLKELGSKLNYDSWEPTDKQSTEMEDAWDAIYDEGPITIDKVKAVGKALLDFSIPAKARRDLVIDTLHRETKTRHHEAVEALKTSVTDGSAAVSAAAVATAQAGVEFVDANVDYAQAVVNKAYVDKKAKDAAEKKDKADKAKTAAEIALADYEKLKAAYGPSDENVTKAYDAWQAADANATAAKGAADDAQKAATAAKDAYDAAKAAADAKNGSNSGSDSGQDSGNGQQVSPQNGQTAVSGNGYAAGSGTNTSNANTGDHSKTLVWLTTLATAGIALAKGLVGRLKTQN